MKTQHRIAVVSGYPVVRSAGVRAALATVTAGSVRGFATCAGMPSGARATGPSLASGWAA